MASGGTGHCRTAALRQCITGNSTCGCPYEFHQSRVQTSRTFLTSAGMHVEGRHACSVAKPAPGDLVPMGTWYDSWLWSVPLIVITVLIHVYGLALANQKLMEAMPRNAGDQRFMPFFVRIMAVTVLLAIMLHALETVLWAAAYRLLNALPDSKAAMLYSLGYR
jgi:hypothetical protein